MHANRILATCLAGIFLASCEPRDSTADWWHGEQERIELSHRLELQQFRYDQLGTGDAAKYAELVRGNAEVAARLKTLRDRQRALAEEVKTLENGWENLRATVLRDRRQEALGTKIATLTVVSGRSYEDVVVSAIDDVGVTIRHASGSARLQVADLSPQQQNLFGLDADLASAALARESENARRYDQWVQAGMVARQAEVERRDDIAQEETAARRARANFQARLLAASRERTVAQPASSTNGRDYSSYSPYRYYSNYDYVAPARCVTPFNSRQAQVEQLGVEFRRKQATLSNK